MKYAELHLHSMDLYDSQNNPSEVCERMAELGAKGFALTQHGTLAGVEPMRAAAASYGLKFVPGIETYYGNDGDIMKNQHLILLATDDTGYQAIGMAVTDAQNEAGYSVMNDEILNKYFAEGALGHGHVIATSACIQGPIGVVLRQNEAVDRNLEKINKRFSRMQKKNGEEVPGQKPQDMTQEIEAAEKEAEALAKEIAEKKELRDKTKKLADSKLTSREKSVAKLEAKGDPGFEEAKAQLEEDKRKIAEAKEEFASLKAEVAALTKKQTAGNRALKELKEKQERFDQYNRLIQETEAQRMSDKEIRLKALEEAMKLSRIFGEGNFYMELQYHGIPTEAYVYPLIAKMAAKLNLPVVATNDVHIVRKTEDERLRRQILRSMRFNENFEEEGVGDEELYIKTDEELKEWLMKILPEDVVDTAIANIKVIFDRCNVEFKTGKHYPKFPVKDGRTTNEVFEDEIRRGIKWRFPNGLPEEYKKRLKKEIDVIEGMGYVDYHLIVKDFLEYGRALGFMPTDKIADAPLEIEEVRKITKANGWDCGVSVGPGRGSAAGSLVCYLLGITNLDPIKYNLLFERRCALLKLR